MISAIQLPCETTCDSLSRREREKSRKLPLTSCYVARLLGADSHLFLERGLGIGQPPEDNSRDCGPLKYVHIPATIGPTRGTIYGLMNFMYNTNRMGGK